MADNGVLMSLKLLSGYNYYLKYFVYSLDMQSKLEYELITTKIRTELIMTETIIDDLSDLFLTFPVVIESLDISYPLFVIHLKEILYYLNALYVHSTLLPPIPYTDIIADGVIQQYNLRI